mmetsp:Transcript_17002/g.23782  ORF Transcript_17002/g.23782 Transcript_17002/m.23782 type:complete len:249 (+) Transcript_17002:1104-1850(+)
MLKTAQLLFKVDKHLIAFILIIAHSRNTGVLFFHFFRICERLLSNRTFQEFLRGGFDFNVVLVFLLPFPVFLLSFPFQFILFLPIIFSIIHLLISIDSSKHCLEFLGANGIVKVYNGKFVLLDVNDKALVPLAASAVQRFDHIPTFVSSICVFRGQPEYDGKYIISFYATSDKGSNFAILFWHAFPIDIHNTPSSSYSSFVSLGVFAYLRAISPANIHTNLLWLEYNLLKLIFAFLHGEMLERSSSLS